MAILKLRNEGGVSAARKNASTAGGGGGSGARAKARNNETQKAGYKKALAMYPELSGGGDGGGGGRGGPSFDFGATDF